jgi:hypothetical protein
LKQARCRRSNFPVIVLLFSLLTMAMFGTLVAALFLPTSDLDASSRETLWLSPNDLSELGKLLEQTDQFPPDRVGEVLGRQVRNVIAQQNRPGFSFLWDWRILSIVAPVIILIGSFAYLRSCYPQAVFLWGDAEEWYQGLVARRKTVWTVIIAAVLIGIITNLAVFAFGSLIAGSSK